MPSNPALYDIEIELMHVTREQFQIDASSYSLDRNSKRAVGCHLSGVIKYMTTTRHKDRDADSVQAGFAAGFMLERVLAQHAIESEMEQNRAGLARIGELVWCYQCNEVFVSAQHCSKRGHVCIAATPDAVLVREWMLLEWKLTKMSLRSAGADVVVSDGDDVNERRDYEHIQVGFWHWVVQMKGYCYLIGELYQQPMLDAMLKVLFVNGDYGATTRDYMPMRYRFRFNDRELRENWDAVVSHAIDSELLEVQ